MTRPTSDAIGQAANSALHRLGVSPPTRSAGWVSTRSSTSVSQARGSTPCIRQVAGSPLMTPMFSAPSGVQAKC